MGDGKLPKSEQLVDWISQVPATWIPALMAACVCRGHKEGFWEGQSVTSFVEDLESRLNDG